jgi:small subunit ribosomal protein S16
MDILRIQTIQEDRVAVKIRMKMMGRKHRPFFRICAVDSRTPRDGRVLEELGTYDPMVGDTDARALLNSERIQYWLGVGAQPSQRVKTLIKKYGAEGTHAESQRAARERLAMPKVVPDAGEPVYVPPSPEAKAEKPAAEAAESSESSGNGSHNESSEEPASVSE